MLTTRCLLRIRVLNCIEVDCGILVYRVGINSFPDYKHLLQENYVEYKYIIFFKK